MEKAYNSWSQNQNIDWQPLNSNLSSAQFGLGSRVMFPSFGNMFSPPVFHETCDRFYSLPRYQQGIAPIVNSIPKASPVVAQETKGVQKKFIVFDQSRDQTTLMYSLGVGPSSTWYQFPSLSKPEPQFGSHVVCADKLVKEDDGSYSKSDMREDSEELNALLYSDDDYDDQHDNDDDQMSTGHSPSSMTVFHGQKRDMESGEEEVASSGGPLKRRKKEEAASLVNTREDTATLGKSGVYCSGNTVFEEEYDNISCRQKTLRIENMKETINMLQNLLPVDKTGKNGIMVIDEAIHYLTSLKVKAKALGIDSF